MNFNHTLGSEFRAIFLTKEADTTLDRLAKLADHAIGELTPEPEAGIVDGLFPPQPDYTANMPDFPDGTVISLYCRDIMDRWTDGEEEDRDEVDRELARGEARVRKRIEERERWTHFDF